VTKAKLRIFDKARAILLKKLQERKSHLHLCTITVVQVLNRCIMPRVKAGNGRKLFVFEIPSYVPVDY